MLKMKILHLAIIVVAILLLIPVMMNNPTKALCMPNPDWPNAPCYGCPGCIPSMEKQQQDWAPYYQYKGASWMEMMKTQMIEAMKNGTLEDWVTGNQSNYNVWRYYYVNDQAPFFRSSVSGLNDEHPYFPPPLQQLTTGIEPKDVACKEGLQLVIKTEDGSPACLRYPTADVLIVRGWAEEVISTIASHETTVIIPVNSSMRSNGFTYTPSIVNVVIGTNNTVRWINMDSVVNDITSSDISFRSGVIKAGYAWTHTFDKPGIYRYYSDIHPWLQGIVIVTSNPMASLANDTGMITLSNQTYYFETPNYTSRAYLHTIQISFHDVDFTLFPNGFRGGLPIPCSNNPESFQYYWTDAKFADNTHELLHILTDSPPCPTNPNPYMLSYHTDPQAGLIFYEGKMKLLVSTESQNDTVNIGNKTFYFTTLNDTLSSYHGVAAIPFTFHGIDFTLFPSAFSAGPPSNSTNPYDSCGNTNFSSEVTFTDGTPENLNVQIPGPPCSENYTQTTLSNHKNPQAGIQVYQGKIRLLASVSQTPENDILPASFTPCDTPYPQNYTGIPVLYMPINSTGKLCVKYSNPNEPFQAGFDILEARDYSKKAEGITASSVPDTVPHGNSTVVYTINSGPKAGFFRMLISCPGMQLAIGYDNSSIFVQGDFPWLDQTFYCGIGHELSISGMSGIGVKYIPWK
jgi:plastocyanin